MEKNKKNNPNLRLRDLLASSRPFSWVNTAAPFIVGYCLGVGAFDLKCVVGLVYFSFFYNFLMYGVNDIFDYESDLKNPRKGGIEGALIAKQKHTLLFWLIIAFNLPFLVFLIISGTISSTVVLIAMVFFCFSYSAKPMRFKEIPFVDSINSSLHFTLPFVFGLLYAGSTNIPWPAIIAFFLWGAASQALGAIQDIRPDRLAGINSIATKLGAKKTNYYSLMMYVLCCLVIIIGYFPVGLIAATILAVYPLNVLFFRKYRSDAKSHEYRRAWQNFIWLNWICGFWLSQLLLYIFDPFGLASQKTTLFAGFLILFAILQLILIIYNYQKFQRPKTKRIGDLPHIDVIFHSTGNKDNIASTLLALIGQNYPHFDIYYANTDHNPQAQKIAESYQDSRLHLVDIGKVPSGWALQSWASEVMLSKTRSEIVVLISADTLLLPNTLSVVASQFESSETELISLLPADQNKSFWQQLIMSQEHYMMLGLYPAALITEHYPRLATAYSTLVAFKSKPIKKAGGFSLVKKSPLEDLDIANKAKQVGLKTRFYIASDLAVSQNRATLPELRKYNEQRLYPSLHFNMPLSIALISGGLTVLVAPIVVLTWLLLIGSYTGTILLATACVLMLINRLIIMLKSKQSIIGGLLYPLGSLFFLMELVISMLRYELFKPRWQSRREL